MKQTITFIMALVIAITSFTSCGNTDAQSANTTTARVQEVMYLSGTGYVLHPMGTIKLKNVSNEFEVGDVISDGGTEYKILSTSNSRTQYGLDILSDSTFIIHSNWDSTTLAILKFKDNKTLDSTLLADNL